MTKIKFRAIAKNINEWVYGCYYELPFHDKDGIDYCIARKEFIDGKFAHTTTFHVKRETVGQYTGLKSVMDDKDIYEGDIVLLKDEVARGDGQYDDEIGEVIWDKNEASFMFKNNMATEYLGHAHPDKVIGNIHDNPELI